ncbi:MAG: sporulation integral membrane protein YtvI [Firmicutes bacterium]|nr:sporulation integral membrane protein YtvI [Bacillota bacterium]
MSELEPARYWHQLLQWSLLVLASYVFWRWLASYVLPFVLAMALAAMVLPVVERMEAWGIGRVGAVVVALGGMLLGLGVLCGAILTLLAAELVEISHRMPGYLRARPLQVTHFIQQWNRLRSHFGLRGGSLSNELRSMYQMLGALAKSIGHVLMTLPEMALVMLIAAIAAFFILRDYQEVLAVAKRLAPPALRHRMGRLTTVMRGGLWGYLRAEFTLVSLTGLATTGGLLLMRAPYAVLIGLTAGFLDMVPFMGPTVLLVPWAAGAALTGHVPMAIHLMMVLAGVAVIRQLIEPRLVGQGTGLHPLVVLFSLYIGIRLFGGAGVVVGPITAVMLNAIRQVMRDSTAG